MNQQSNTKRILTIAIIAQCAGKLSFLLFDNGFMLNFLAKLGMQSSSIMYTLSLPKLSYAFIAIPAAFLSDWKGKKKIGTIGLVITVIGFAIINIVTVFNLPYLVLFIIFGIIIYSIGNATFSSNWTALLSAIIPENIRGRFYGTLRMLWQTVALIATWIIFYILNKNNSMNLYEILLVVVTLTLVLRLLFYMQIPEVETTRPSKICFKSSIVYVLSIPGFLAFLTYVFLLMFLTGACPWIFSLLEKDILMFTEQQIILMGNLLFIGSIVGFIFSGRIIDRIGTKYIFLVSHLSFIVIIFSFLLRGFFAFSHYLFFIGALTFIFGFIKSSFNIAITTELLSVIHIKNKSLATALTLSLLHGGSSLSALLWGKTLDLNILNQEWFLFGNRLSEYDSLLLINSALLILVIITLGLIPSVFKNIQKNARG